MSVSESGAVKLRSAGVVQLKIARQFKALHTDPRFEKMLAEVGLDTDAE